MEKEHNATRKGFLSAKMVVFANAEKQVSELVESIHEVLVKGGVSVLEAHSLRGRIQCADGPLFGRV